MMKMPSSSVSVRVLFSILTVVAALLAIPVPARAQGETTSAILGEVTDSSNAALAGAVVTITNRDTGLKRSAQTDEAGRFNFPQLLPGVYSVQASAPGFEPQQLQIVFAGLGQKQAVTLVLRVAEAKESVEVTAEASILNPSNANTSTSLNASALENLPNPGGDLTYPPTIRGGGAHQHGW
jgi:hypothetical protein